MVLALVAIIAVIAATVLAALGKIPERWLPWSLFVVAILLLYQTSMMGAWLVGSDIHREYYSSMQALQNGWDFSTSPMSNSSIVIGLIAPFIARLMPLVWVFKAVLPFIFAFVPVILYFAFKKQFGSKRAFFAAMFFMVVPVFSLEIPQIAKSMVAEVFFALMILAMVSDLKWKWKCPAVGITLGLAALCHYSVGFIAACYIFGALVFMAVTKPVKWGLLARRKLPLVGTSIAVLLVLSGCFFYFQRASEGSVLLALKQISGWDISVPVASEQPPSAAISSEGDVENGGGGVQIPASEGNALNPVADSVTEKKPMQLYPEYLKTQSHLVQAGIGLDFAEATAQGKAFRIVQYLTQLLIVTGFFWLIFKHRRYRFTAEFVACIAGSFALLAACVFTPGFSYILNMTRFYQLTLFFLAPMFVLGVDALSGGLSKIGKGRS